MYICVCTHMCMYDVNTEECLIGKKNKSRETGGEGTGRAVRADVNKVQWCICLWKRHNKSCCFICCIGHFPCCCDKIAWWSHLNGERVYWAQLEGIVHHGGETIKAGAGGLWSHCLYSQEEGNGWSPLSSWFRPGLQPMEWYSPQSIWVFLP